MPPRFMAITGVPTASASTPTIPGFRQRAGNRRRALRSLPQRRPIQPADRGGLAEVLTAQPGDAELAAWFRLLEGAQSNVDALVMDEASREHEVRARCGLARIDRNGGETTSAPGRPTSSRHAAM